jgi:hypothetical protein
MMVRHTGTMRTLLEVTGEEKRLQSEIAEQTSKIDFRKKSQDSKNDLSNKYQHCKKNSVKSSRRVKTVSEIAGQKEKNQ